MNAEADTTTNPEKTVPCRSPSIVSILAGKYQSTISKVSQ
jgi:hypothetical protein